MDTSTHSASARREQDNQSLRNERFRLLVQGVTDYAIFMLDPEGHVICWNTGAEHVFGYLDAEIIGQHYAKFFTSDAIARDEPERELRMANASGRFAAERWRVRKDASQFLADVVIASIRDTESGKFLGYSQITRDVTERRRQEDLRRVEEQLRHTQKMDAVGSLAAGVAHDFNNLLTVINGYGHLLLGKLPSHDETRGPVQQMVNAGERAAALTRQLLAFSRKQILRPKVLDLNALLQEFETLLLKFIGSGIELRLDPCPDLKRVEADPVQLEQVLMNLAINARDAMPMGGVLTIRTSNVMLGLDGSPIPIELKAGAYVLLSVTDTGEGMNEATRLRVFEPFFTTKPMGRGTGFGLATVYGVVKQSAGHVEVSSRLNEGTVFTVYLPAVDAPNREDTLQPFANDAAGGGETVLLVEDEEGIQKLSLHLLQKGGYQVLVASNGQEALDVAAAYPGPIHLLVTDVMMPGIGGLQLMKRLEQLRPEMKVVFMSGFSEEAVAHPEAFGPSAPFLQKPFTPRNLASKVRETLDGTFSASPVVPN